MERMMEMQYDLFRLGIFPSALLEDDNNESNDEDEKEKFIIPSPYKIPRSDIFEESLPAFHLGFIYDDQDGNKDYIPNPFGADAFRYRGEITAPKEWYFRQTCLKEYFKSTG
jgi:hypothetical protein